VVVPGCGPAPAGGPAVNALQEEGASVAELANRLGYRSEAAFSRAFKRFVGRSPGAVKRQPGGAGLVPAA
jgi:AraC-like DNA-binding protein